MFRQIGRLWGSVKYALEQVMKAQKGEEIYFYSFFNLGTRYGCVVNATNRPIHPRQKDPMPIVHEAG
jgi:hypothetical protein